MDPSPSTQSFDAIKVPQAPATEPDKETSEEGKHLDKAAREAKLTPTDRICAAHTSHLNYIQGEHRRLLGEVSELRLRLETLVPEHAALRQASRTNSFIDILGFAISGLGAGAISAASLGYMTAYTHHLFSGGSVALVAGYAMLIFVKLFCWPKAGSK